jgi:branched-chain amino acid transport system substrate-binding protein
MKNLTNNKMQLLSNLTFSCLLTLGVAAGAVADESSKPIKVGLSVPMSGAAALWGQGADWMCKKASEEIRDSGGVVVDGTTYNYECITYDNKYNAAEGAKVARALLQREGVEFIGGSLGTAPVRALQSLSERMGVLIFTTAWGDQIKGPDYPLTFTQMNTPHEILEPLISYVSEAHPEAESVAILNPNDATGQQTEAVSTKAWGKVGLEVVSSDFYERGTTEYQPIALRLARHDPDVIDLGATPPAEAGAIFKELDVIGWDGVKLVEVGTGADGLTAIGGDSVEGVYMGAAVAFNGPSVTDHQKRVNEEAREDLGESLNTVQIGFYDSLFALKAAMEKSQSIEPKKVAEALPSVTFQSFYGNTARFGGEETYGSPQQMMLPVIVTRIEQGELVELGRINPTE